MRKGSNNKTVFSSTRQMIVYKIITLWIEEQRATNLPQEWSSAVRHRRESPATLRALSWRGRQSKLLPERAWQADLTPGDMMMASWSQSTWVPLICQIFTECLQWTDNGAGATKPEKGEVRAPREPSRLRGEKTALVLKAKTLPWHTPRTVAWCLWLPPF